MKRYVILKEILVDLMDGRGIVPRGEGFCEDSGFAQPNQGLELESDETGFWLVQGDKKWKSKNTLSTLDYWLKQGDIAEKQGAQEGSGNK